MSAVVIVFLALMVPVSLHCSEEASTVAAQVAWAVIGLAQLAAAAVLALGAAR